MTDPCTLTASAMRGAMERGALSSAELVEAHLSRISRHDGAIKAFTRVFAETARADARRLDDERRGGVVRGPLHGVPVSVKECFDLEGLATTAGIPNRGGHRATRDAAMITLLREAGAVILGRTNLSQTMLFSESRNPIFGQTANPFSLAHSPGGSSGGEAAAVASGMSPLGLGTDIGGSIRSPAAVTGVFGIKPTLDRLPTTGQYGVLKGQEGIRSVPGPLARSTEDLWLFLSALDPARMSALDPRVPPLPWVDPVGVEVPRLRVGYYAHDGVLAPSAAVERAVETAAGALDKLGCAVTIFTPPDVPSLFDDYLGALSADGGETIRDALGHDPADPSLKPLLALAMVPDAGRLALAKVAGAVGQSRAQRLLDAVGARTVADYWKLIDRIRSYRARLLDAMDAVGVDVVLCPGFATPALPHGMSKNFTAAATPALLWNAVQFPAGVVPVTKVRAEETTRALARDMVERHAAKVDAESAGLPVGVQVVARPWQESRVLAVMSALEGALRGSDDYPVTPVTPG